MTFNLGFSRMFLPAIFEIYYSYHKAIWMAEIDFYPTALKGCQGIVFTHGVWMGGWAGGGKKFVRAVSQKP